TSLPKRYAAPWPTRNAMLSLDMMPVAADIAPIRVPAARAVAPVAASAPPSLDVAPDGATASAAAILMVPIHVIRPLRAAVTPAVIFEPNAIPSPAIARLIGQMWVTIPSNA